MNRSNEVAASLQEVSPALQHERGPRPLPLFLDLVRELGRNSPQLARSALRGLALYQAAPRAAAGGYRSALTATGPARLVDHGGSGAPVVLVPSLINPPAVLDLDKDVSLAAAVRDMGRRVYLLDWGPAGDRAELDVAGHVERLLVPLLARLDRPPALIGYCLGGTMALGAAAIAPVERIVTLASPWHFSAYPAQARADLHRLWAASQGPARQLGVLPMELMQAAFWSLDPRRTAAKFAAFADMPQESAQAQRFVALEDWANQGEPLPFPAARELIEDFFGRDLPGQGEWRIAGQRVTGTPAVPTLHCTASDDRIAPAGSAPAGESLAIAGGHVGMVIGRSRTQMLAALPPFLGACRSR